MSDSSWLEFAKSLPEGKHRKHSHSCGPGEPRIVNHKVEGYSWSCFRCGETGYQRKPSESLAERIARLQRVQAVERAASFSVSLPTPAVHDVSLWPLAARCWLYRAGISNVEISALGFYWHPGMERVVLPVRDADSNVIYWQARTLDKTNIRKYTNPLNVEKDRLLARYGTGGAIVLTEDILSAYRVSRAGYEGVSLLGTKLSVYVATQLLKDKRPKFLWLDPDGPGRKAARGILKTLRAYGVPVTNVVSDRDPKLLSKGEIIELIGSYQNSTPKLSYD